MSSAPTRLYHDAAISEAITALAYGVHTTLYLAALSALAKRTSKRPYFLLVTITLMFITSTAFFTLVTFLKARALLALYRSDIFIALTARTAGPAAALARINYILSDAIVTWRAWILWPQNRPVMCALALALLLTTVGGFSEFGYTYAKYGPSSATSSLPDRTDNVIRACAAALLVVLTNLLSTTLVAIKVWQYRRDVKSHLGRTTQTRVEKILLLLAESGVLYSAIWLAYLAVGFDNVDVYDGHDLTVADGISVVIPSIAGIYPTLVVLICALQNSPTHHIETIGLNASMCDSGGTPADARAGVRPGEALIFHVTDSAGSTVATSGSRP
ncbi:hypothetical protein BD626DRAFT_572595 [Schizophyllum amplum]|uniref:Uncharacterized protein n=1 Tax=Schizophyllum amplum TaxID=97359 RepID=A0A550C4C3_9AGAR|nr:hypothetical protein BD626DRAFT_572595 [Auriculariopsis ampla]